MFSLSQQNVKSSRQDQHWISNADYNGPEQNVKISDNKVVFHKTNFNLFWDSVLSIFFVKVSSC